MYIDTHTHIYCEDFNADRHEALRRAREAGARALLLPNIDAASIAPMLALCEAYPQFCYPMMGLHPTELPTEGTTRVLDLMEQELQDHPGRYIAIGEVGLDFYWDRSREEEQKQVFQRQLEWAVRFNLPLVIHSRSAHRELVEALLPQANKVRGIFHCFSGSREEATDLLTRFPHFMLGIGGVLTFKKCKLPDTLSQAVPLSRIVLETDSPWLAPTPHRGKRNEPAYIPLIIDKLSEIYQVAPDTIAQATTHNATTIFHTL